MEEDICAEYRSSLMDLTCNSKPLISMLTMLAEDNLENAKEIVKVIETHLHKVQADIKLPVLYLIDSVVKNVGQQYLSLFTQSIVSNFCSVFEKGDEKTRMQLFKLRQTWNNIFPNKKLYAIDARVNSIDPAWPITADKPSQQNIHVNPKFFESKQQQPTTNAVTEKDTKTQELQAEVRQQLWAKQQELLKLQQQKLELELIQTKAKLEEQTRLLSIREKEDTTNQRFPNQVSSQPVSNLEFMASGMKNDVKHLVPPIVPQRFSNTISPSSPATIPIHSIDPRISTRDPRISSRDPRLHRLSACTTTMSSVLQKPLSTIAPFGKRSNAVAVTENLSITNAANCSVPPPSIASFQNVSHQTHEPISSDLLMPPSTIIKPADSITNKTNFSLPIQKPDIPASKSVLGQKSVSLHSLCDINTTNLGKQASILEGLKQSSPVRRSKPREDQHDIKGSNDSPKKISSPKKVSPGKRNDAKKAKASEQSKSGEIKPNKEKRENMNKINTNKSLVKEKEKIDAIKLDNQSLEHKARKGKNLDKTSKNNLESKEDMKHENFNIPNRVTRSQINKMTKLEETSRERSRSPIAKKSDKNFKKPEELRSSCQELSAKPKNRVKVSELNKENKKIESPATKEFPEHVIRDVDLRVSPESSETASQKNEHNKTNKRELDTKFSNVKNEDGKESVNEPPLKKTKDDEHKMDMLFGIQDQDYRQISQITDDELSKNGNHKGWARFKQIYPDEFKSPLRPSRENVDATIKPPDEYAQGFGFQINSPRNWGRDSLGRPLLSHMRNDRHFRQRRYDRYGGNFLHYGKHQQMRAQMELMLANEKQILQQAEQQLHSGRMTIEQYEELRSQLESLYDRQRMQGLQRNFDRYAELHRFREKQFNNSNEQNNPVSRVDCSNTENKQEENVEQEQILKSEAVVDPKTLPPIRSIMIDKQLRKIHFVGQTGVILMENDDPREISFKGSTKKVFINDMEPILLNFGGEIKDFTLNGKKHTLKFGAPSRELYIDNHPYEIRFGGPPIKVTLDGGFHTIYLEGPPPNVQIGEESRKDILKEINANLHGDISTTSNSVDKPLSNLKPEELSDKQPVAKNCSKEPTSTLPPSKDTDLRPDMQKKEDLISDQDQDLRHKTSESFNEVAEQMAHDIDMRSVAESDETDTDPKTSHHHDHADARKTDIKEELPVSGLQDIDWRPVLHSADTNSPNRSPSARGSPLHNQNSMHSHLSVDEQQYSQPPAEPQRQESSSMKRVINERYQNPPQNQFRNVPPYWNKEREERQWEPPGRTEVGANNPLRQDKRELAGNTHHANWEPRENHGQWQWEEHNRYGNQMNERLPEVRDNRWPDYPPPAVPNQSLGPRRDEPPPPPISLPLPLPLPPHSICPPPGKHYPREQWPSQNQRGRNQRWQDRRKENDNWEWRDEFKPGHRNLPFRPNWNSPTHHSEEYPTYYREGVPRPAPPPQPQPPPPLPQSRMPFHNPPARFPARGAAHRRNQSGLGPRRLMEHGPRMPLLGHQENFPRPMLIGPMDACSSNVPRVGFNPPHVALPPDAQLPSYPPRFPLAEQRFVGPNQQELPYDPSISNAQVQLPGASVPPTSEVSNPPAYPIPMPNIDVNTLFEKLIAAGIIAETKSSTSEENETQNKSEDKSKAAEATDDEKIPPLNFSNTEVLKCRYNGVINALYRGTQCASCGLRFTEGQQDRYSQHLDWHFRVNRREKDGARKAFSRKWFYDVEDWIQFEEIEDLEERARSFFELQADEEQFQVSDQVEVPSVVASENESENSCVVCGEHLKQFWVEEEEEWHLRDAVRIDNQTYHPLCYEDFKKTSEAPETPVDVTGDPLLVTSTIKKEDEEQKDETPKNEQPSESVSVDSSKQTVTESDSTNDEQVQKNNTVPEETTETSANEVKTEVKEEPLEMKELVEVKEEPIEVKEQQMEFDEESKAAEEIETASTSDLCAMVENTSIKEEEARPESKMVVLKSGGIVMKVRADSIAMPASPASVSKAVPSENIDTDDIEEMEYPPPDPRFKVLPPVQRGTELSGLCSIIQVRLQKHQLTYPGDPLFVASTIKKEDEEQKDETLQNEQPSESVSVDSSKQTVTESDSINDEQVKKNIVPEESSETSANEVKTEVKEELIEVKEQQMEFDEEIKAAEQIETASTSDLCAMVENKSIKEEEPRPKCKMVVLKSRGIVMKVRADSIAMPTLPVSVSKIVPSENVDIEEMEYPPPDSRFKVLPPVQRGTELSGLCSIM